MLIDILRHAIAEDRRPNLPDADRELTADGREKLKAVLSRAGKSKVKPSVILSSPLVRAVQTAEMAASALKCKRLIQVKTLIPGTAAEETWNEISKFSDADEVMVVGHEPHLGRFAAFLLGTPSLAIDFKKAGLMQLSREGEHTTLEWYLVPRLCR